MNEQTLKTMSMPWPHKLYVTESNLAYLKVLALRDGVTEEFWDKWVEDCIEIVEPHL